MTFWNEFLTRKTSHSQSSLEQKFRHESFSSRPSSLSGFLSVWHLQLMQQGEECCSQHDGFDESLHSPLKRQSENEAVKTQQNTFSFAFHASSITYYYYYYINIQQTAHSDDTLATVPMLVSTPAITLLPQDKKRKEFTYKIQKYMSGFKSFQISTLMNTMLPENSVTHSNDSD